MKCGSLVRFFDVKFIKIPFWSDTYLRMFVWGKWIGTSSRSCPSPPAPCGRRSFHSCCRGLTLLVVRLVLAPCNSGMMLLQQEKWGRKQEKWLERLEQQKQTAHAHQNARRACYDLVGGNFATSRKLPSRRHFYIWWSWMSGGDGGVWRWMKGMIVKFFFLL